MSGEMGATKLARREPKRALQPRYGVASLQLLMPVVDGWLSRRRLGSHLNGSEKARIIDSRESWIGCFTIATLQYQLEIEMPTLL